MLNELKSMSNNWIYQSNRLIEASYTLTVMEQKLIRLLASMIKKDDDDFKEYKFKTKELIKILNTSDSRFYRDIDNITDSIMQRVIKIKDINTGEFEKYHWVDVCKYKDGVLILKVNKELKPFYLNLDWYTKYQLKNIMQFKSTYSFRLYELLKQYEKIGIRSITIDDFRCVLDIDDKQYPKYANLKQKVISVAVNEINSKTDLYIEYEEIKKVRKITSLKFYIKHNENVKSERAIDLEDLNRENINYDINIVKNLIGDISYSEAYKILNAADYDIEKVKEKYNVVSKIKNINNLVGAMMQSIKDDWTVAEVINNKFNNFEARTYDYNELEANLLGWNKE